MTCSCAKCQEEKNVLQQRIAELEKCLIKEAYTDVLTGLANRRSFDKRLVEEVERARRGIGEPISLAMFDLDYFKCVNDTYGHDVGDKVLMKVGKILRHHARASDIVARIGGEEFAFVLPSTSLERAHLFIGRLRALIESDLKVHVGRKVVVAVTASFGVTVLHAGEKASHFLKRADTALYVAKHEGRNRVNTVAAPAS